MANKTALIVDDSSTAQYRLKKMLRPYNLQIDAVDSGEAALDYLARKLPDVIFMDHLMPGMDGLRALQIIKSHPETAMVPVIMYTAQSGDLYTGQARALGALDVVSKDTINAMDLSKVMQAIHLTPDNTADKTAPVESPELIAAANSVSEQPISDGQFISNGQTINEQLSDADYPFIERRAPNQTLIDQTRNLELRLSHLEHSLEDNRRVITSRVVRELQSLRHGLRQELGELFAKQLPKATAVVPPAAEPPAAAPPRSSSGWLLVAILLLVAIYYLFTIDQQLAQLDQPPSAQAAPQQVQQPAMAPEPQAAAPAPDATTEPAAEDSEAALYRNQQLLDDLSWAFNQSGAISFQQNTLEPSAALRIYDFIERLRDNHFVGTVTLDIFVGDFCLLLDAQGEGQLAPANSTLSGCILSSETYNLERVRSNYSRALESSLERFSGTASDSIRIQINSYMGPEPYPERLPIVNAGEWNAIAQRNNRIEVHLQAAPTPQ